MEVLLISLFQVGSDRARLVFPTSPSLISGWSVGCRAIYFQKSCSLFCQVGCLLFVFGCMFEFLVVTICSQKGDELFSGEVEIFDALAYQYDYIMFLGSARCLNVVFPTFENLRSRFSFFATFYNNDLCW